MIDEHCVGCIKIKKDDFMQYDEDSMILKKPFSILFHHGICFTTDENGKFENLCRFSSEMRKVHFSDEVSSNIYEILSL